MDRCVDDPQVLKSSYVELPQKWGGCGTVEGLKKGHDTLFIIRFNDGSEGEVPLKRGNKGKVPFQIKGRVE